MELFILTVKPIENKYARTLIFFAYFCNKQIPYPVFFVKAPTLRRTDEGRSKNIVLTKKSITMKRLLALLAILLISQVGYGQQKMDQLFNAFRGESDVTSVNIGNITMKLASLFTETMGVNGIEILEFDNCAQEVKDRLSTAIRNLRDERDSRTKVLVKIKEDMIRELVIFTTGSDNALIRIKGKISPSDLDRVINEHKTGNY